ncbi:MAG: DUF6057 family protein, partial [Bacteroidales bacterium]|nr:DUF6057 family protein [Bacteroidales bacterium]
GLINTAQRYVFEAQEAILDYQKSGRCYKRLAETNLITGNYDVARKYLLTLKKTLIYRQWATETLALLGNEKAIDQHKEYGELRRMMMKKDLFFDDNNHNWILWELWASNKSNRMAFEYMLAGCMLEKDLDGFVNCFGSNTEINYPTIPSLYQQVLIQWWTRDHSNSSQTPMGIRPETDAMFKKFIIDFGQHKNNPQWLEKQYGNTFWYYFISH